MNGGKKFPSARRMIGTLQRATAIEPFRFFCRRRPTTNVLPLSTPLHVYNRTPMTFSGVDPSSRYRVVITIILLLSLAHITVACTLQCATARSGVIFSLSHLTRIFLRRAPHNRPVGTQNSSDLRRSGPNRAMILDFKCAYIARSKRRHAGGCVQIIIILYSFDVSRALHITCELHPTRLCIEWRSINWNELNARRGS